MKKSDCVVCFQPTKNIFNISFKPTPICEQCATAIFIQQATYYAQLSRTIIDEKKSDIKRLKKMNNDQIYIQCPDCHGEGVVEKTLYNDGIEIDAPCHCWTCDGSGKVLKDVEDAEVL